MRVLSKVSLTLLATTFVACGSPPISKELRTARDAYAAAEASVAAELAPAELDNARQALERAEETFRKNHQSPQMVDDAYIAERAAQLALVVGLTEQEKRAKKEAEKKLEKMEKRRASMTADELEAARAELADKKRQLADQQADLNKTSAQLGEERAARMAAEGKLSAALVSLKEAGNVKEEARGVVITLSGSVLFATGKYVLLPIAREKLAEVATALKDQGFKRIVVEGHTDSRGSESTNESLSLKRANSVRSFLVEQGLDGSKVVASGLGESRPIAPNDTPDGRANNRRVELVVTPE
jgi:outer membrane protein OmpA-like peptidoglycan-associated protein